MKYYSVTNKKEQTSDTHDSDESQMHYAKSKQPDSIRLLIVWFHLNDSLEKTDGRDQWLPGTQVGKKDGLHQWVQEGLKGGGLEP